MTSPIHLLKFELRRTRQLRDAPRLLSASQCASYLAESMREGAGMNLRTDGAVDLCAGFLLPDRTVEFIRILEDDGSPASHEAMDGFLRERGAASEASAVCVVFEAWTAFHEDADGRAAGERPDRTEHIFCCLSLPDRTLSWVSNISRQDGKPSAGPWEDAGALVGRFSDLIRQNVPEA